MSRTTVIAAVDLAQAVPGLAEHARTAVRLHPRPGSPGPHESHIGGPFLWPASQPWPRCQDPECDQGSGAPMVALAQLTAADFPEIEFPPGTDLLQIPWCVGYHGGSVVRPIWRRAADVTEILTSPPVPDLSGELPGFYETYIPRPCVLHPERVIEYPYAAELPAELRERAQSLDPDDAHFYDDRAVAPGVKLGGTAYGQPDQRCEICRNPGVLLLQLGNFELNDHWDTVEDRDLANGSQESEDSTFPTGMMYDVGTGSLFACSADPNHGLSFHTP